MARIEAAYEDSLTVTPELIPNVPEEADLLTYHLTRTNPRMESVGVFTVGVIFTARYTVYRENGGYVTTGTANTTTSDDVTVEHHDQTVGAATYRVTDREISREFGIGSLTGTVHCW